MSDDKRAAGLYRRLIDLDNDHDVQGWMKHFGCTEEQLRKAVAAMNNSADIALMQFANFK